MSNNIYITTPIYYVNGSPHVGTAYTTIAADVLSRYYKQLGKDVFFLTGTDEHGQKVEEAAKLTKKDPQIYVDEIVPKFKKMWEILGIENDDFIRTTEERHLKSVYKILKKVYDKGDIYKGNYEGLYCVSCENFVTQSQAEDNKCPDCGKELKKVKEESYFFKMSKYQDVLLSHIEKNPDFIQPSYRKNEVISFIKQGLKDLSISRNTFEWGIPFEMDKSHVIYVWFDALTNYLTAIGYENDNNKYNKFWDNGKIIHLIGKDILRFHAIIWPIMLLSADIKLPDTIFAHGWWTVEGEKMSKSKGNVVDPEEEVKKYGLDVFRYFLLRETNFGQDGDYSKHAILTRINADLANDLGNLLNRTIGMISKYNDNLILKYNGDDEFSEDIKTKMNDTLKNIKEFMEKTQFSKALDSLWYMISRMNKYIDETMPWKLAKEEDKKNDLNRVMYNLANTLYKIAVLLYPTMPETSEKIIYQLGIKEEIKNTKLEDLNKWENIEYNTKVKKAQPIFPRIDIEEELKEDKKVIEEEKITIDYFNKMKIQVVEILEVENIKDADKLLNFKVKLGENNIKNIVSGLAKFYTKEELVGKKTLLLSNLKPAKIRSIMSEGMLLTTCTKKKTKLVFVDNDIPNGTVIK